MYNIGKYNQQDKMCDLVYDNYQMILVIGRFGISMGFGDKPIGEVCAENNVDTNVFLAIVNLLIESEEGIKTFSAPNLSAEAIVKYLKNSHHYYLTYKLPAIRIKLEESMSKDKNSITDMVVSFFDEYVEEVNRHMMYEENTVFVYIDRLLKGEETEGYNIDVFGKHHDNIDEKLTEFRNVVIKYYPAASSDELNTVLLDILTFAKDLNSHSDVEDYILVPTIRDIEKEKGA